MRKKQISIVFLFLIVSAFALPMAGNAEASKTTVEIYPEKTLVLEIGDTFTVSIDINDVINLFAMQFVLRYNSNILQLTDVDSGMFPTPRPPHSPVHWELDIEWTGVPTICCGYDCDVVQDGVIDHYDYADLMPRYWSEYGDLRWSPRADINKDWVIDISDLGLWWLALWNTQAVRPGTIQFDLGESVVIDGDEVLGYWASGSGTLATVTFKAIGFGQTLLDLDNAEFCQVFATSISAEVKDGTVTVPPIEPVQDLAIIIESWDLPKGTESSLTSLLEAATSLLEKGNFNGATHKLVDFENKVKALRGKKLTDEQADYLISEAQRIINLLEG